MMIFFLQIIGVQKYNIFFISQFFFDDESHASHGIVHAVSIGGNIKISGSFFFDNCQSLFKGS